MIAFPLGSSVLICVGKYQHLGATVGGVLTYQAKQTAPPVIQIQALDHRSHIVLHGRATVCRQVRKRQYCQLVTEQRRLPGHKVRRAGVIHPVAAVLAAAGSHPRRAQSRRVCSTTYGKTAVIPPIVPVQLQIGKGALHIPPPHPPPHRAHAQVAEQILRISARGGHGGNHISKFVVKFVVEQGADVPLEPLALQQRNRVVVRQACQGLQIRATVQRPGIQHLPGFLFVLAVVDHFQIAGVAGKCQFQQLFANIRAIVL